MKLLNWFFIFLTASIFTSYAQTDQYRLDQYVNPDYKRQSLDFELETAGTFRKEKRKENNDSNEESLHSLSSDFVSSFNRIQNSLSKQSNIYSKIELSGYSNKEENPDESFNKNNYFSVSLYYEDVSRFYLKDKQFIEFSPQFAGSFEKDKKRGITVSDTKNLFTNLSFRLGYGKGRIEHVEDARLAIYVLKDLKKNAILKGDISHDDITKLAECMTKIKYKRQFDSRTKLIEEIATIDSFLIANDIVESTNGSPYFTALYDNWQYAGLITRLSGSRFSFGIKPEYYFHKRTFGENKSYNSRIQGTAYANYNYEKPVNLYWQHSFSAEIGESIGRERYADDSYWDTYLNLSAKLGYYPNSRTYMTASINENMDYLTRDSYNSFYSTTSLSFNTYYYFSPQLRLEANAAIAYSYSKYDFEMSNSNEKDKYSYKQPFLTFGAKLTYSIF